jgi:hypothetical protein
LPEPKRQNILALDKIYQRGGYFVTAAFVVNAILSAIVVFDNYLDSKTVTAYLTNVLFMAAKVNNVYAIANTDQNVFYSAYLTNKVQYNDVDPDKMRDLDVSLHGDIEAMIDCPPEREPVVVESVTEPVVESITEPVVESVTEPVVESVTEPVTEPVTESVTESVAEPVA